MDAATRVADLVPATAEASSRLDPVACATFLLAAFVLAGVAQTAWFKSPHSRAFAWPIDGGLTLRGRRLFGMNKTVRGFVVMIPAAAAAFTVLRWLIDPAAIGLWVLPPSGYTALGAWAAMGFMAGELPNSFVKRQLGIEPGRGASRPAARWLQFAADRLDSGVGMLAAVSLVASTPWRTWLYVLLAGAVLHWGFSALMFHLGLKPRAA
jgi:CDP-diglyceride synthetase